MGCLAAICVARDHPVQPPRRTYRSLLRDPCLLPASSRQVHPFYQRSATTFLSTVPARNCILISLLHHPYLPLLRCPAVITETQGVTMAKTNRSPYAENPCRVCGKKIRLTRVQHDAEKDPRDRATLWPDVQRRGVVVCKRCATATMRTEMDRLEEAGILEGVGD